MRDVETRDRLERNTWGESGPERVRESSNSTEEKTRATREFPLFKEGTIKGSKRKCRESAMEGTRNRFQRTAALSQET